MSEENLNEENLEDIEATEAEEVVDEATEAEVEETSEETSAEEELERRYMSLYAEYENFRKRTAKEKEDLYASAVASVTGDWLAVLDNIDRAIESSRNADENTVEKVIQGVELVGKQAASILEKLGVKEIEAARGVAFDPNLHEAVMHVEDDELGANEIATVFQKGYIYKDRVVRHAVVQVAN
ncbi:MAG: nucleotide exchange factor GrpE [Saccharofermentans sp.]|nr:nucleotide exchange factor GrpE [Saccharofermentans sp.]